jgi:hypothetical protein
MAPKPRPSARSSKSVYDASESGTKRGAKRTRPRNQADATPTNIVTAYNDAEEQEDNPYNGMIENENLIVQLNVQHQDTPLAAPDTIMCSQSSIKPAESDGGVSPMLYCSSAASSHHQHAPYTPTNAFQSSPMDVTGPDNSSTSNIATVAPMDNHTQQQNSNQPKVVELLKEFEMKSRSEEWPASTSTCCYWCCHAFNNAPYGIPVKYTEQCNTSNTNGGKFSVYGCFCSLECASAYNFDSSSETIDEKWERYNLINFLARRLGTESIGRVKLAPNRLALKMFGGHMDIEEFRASAKTSKLVNVNFPPMTTLTQQVEEINDTDTRSEYRYIPLDIDRINRYKEKMVLKRSKPTTAFKKNTLDSLMNLRFSSN